MYQAFQIDDQEEIIEKQKSNQFQFTGKYSNFLKPNFIISQEDEYHEQVDSKQVSKQKIVHSEESSAHNAQKQPAQSLSSNLNVQKEQFYDRWHGSLFQKKQEPLPMPQIKKKDHQDIQKQKGKKEHEYSQNLVYPNRDMNKPSNKDNILFLYDEEEDQEIVQQVKKQQDIHIPRRQIGQIFGLDSELISQQELINITKASQYFETKNKEALAGQLLACIQRSHNLKMEIKRQNSGTNMFWPQYQLRFHNQTAFCYAKRTTARPVATYLFSLAANEFDQSLSSYFGKIKTNIIGNILYIYGPGLNPKNAETKGVAPRQMMATVVYETSFMNQTKPRSFTVYIKHPGTNYFSLKGVKAGDEIGLDQLFISCEQNREHISIYQNSKPIWNAKVGGFMLNFKGRVKEPSVKNFILQDVDGEEVMMFGKQVENIFNIEVKDRLSPLVTFGIALSAFDSKFLCQ